MVSVHGNGWKHPVREAVGAPDLCPYLTRGRTRTKLTGSLARAEEAVKLVEAKKIWDRAPHNAFRDLVRFQDRWYCVFREGQSHVSPDGALRVITCTSTPITNNPATRGVFFWSSMLPPSFPIDVSGDSACGATRRVRAKHQASVASARASGDTPDDRPNSSSRRGREPSQIAVRDPTPATVHI